MIELLVLLGVAMHFCKAMVGRRIEGRPIKPIEYWKRNPYQSLITILGALTGYLVLTQTGTPTPMEAVSAGFLANSFADTIGHRQNQS